MKKLIRNLLIGLGLLAVSTLGVNAQRSETLTWPRTNVSEEVIVQRVSSSQIIAGDSVILYQGQTAMLTEFSTKVVPYAGAYNTMGSTDTVKIYSTYNNSPVSVGYVADTVLGANIAGISHTSTNIGNVDGKLYYMIIPSSKFSGGDAYLDVFCKFIIFR